MHVNSLRALGAPHMRPVTSNDLWTNLFDHLDAGEQPIDCNLRISHIVQLLPADLAVHMLLRQRTCPGFPVLSVDSIHCRQPCHCQMLMPSPMPQVLMAHLKSSEMLHIVC